MLWKKREIARLSAGSVSFAGHQYFLWWLLLLQGLLRMKQIIEDKMTLRWNALVYLKDEIYNVHKPCQVRSLGLWTKFFLSSETLMIILAGGWVGNTYKIIFCHYKLILLQLYSPPFFQRISEKGLNLLQM